MSNIEYYGIPYQDDDEVRNYRLLQRRKAKRLAERYNKNKEVIELIEKQEEQRQQEAFAAYQKMRAKRKYNYNRDAELYHLDCRR